MPPGISTINASAGLNPVLWKSLQKGMTKKIVNAISQDMILDSSTCPPVMYDNDLPAGFFVHTPVGVTRLPIYCVAFFNNLSGLCIAYYATFSSGKKGEKRFLRRVQAMGTFKAISMGLLIAFQEFECVWSQV